VLVSDIIYSALRVIGGGTFASGETPSTSETADALLALNLMLETWSNEQLSVYQVINYSHALTGGTQSYTIGSGGAFDTPRPVKIQTPGITVSGLRHDLKMLSAADWAKIPEKGLTGLLPRGVYNDNGYPLATLNFSPIPNVAVTFDAYLWSPLQQFAAATDTVELPPAYARALKFNLAVDIANEYGLPVSDVVGAEAQASKKAIVTLNLSNALADLPSDNPEPPAAPAAPQQ
jgi:hypothetical protein